MPLVRVSNGGAYKTMFFARYTSGGAQESAMVALDFRDLTKTKQWPSRTSPISNACGYNAVLQAPSSSTKSTISSVNGGTYDYAYGSIDSNGVVSVAYSDTVKVSAGGTIVSWLAKTYNTVWVYEK